MPRAPRIQIAGGIYHVTNRGNDGRAIVLDSADRGLFLVHLADVVARFRWLCLAYCLLDNHYHLVVETPEPNLSAGMQRLDSVYAQRFNRLHGRTGHLWQGRYWAAPVVRGAHLLELTRYVALNPVRAGVCTAPGEWRWSSYPATIGLERPPSFLAVASLLAIFDDDPVRAGQRYRAFVIDGDPSGRSRRYGSGIAGDSASISRARRWPSKIASAISCGATQSPIR